MDNKINSRLEEYKILKEEAKIFTNQTFRDFQLFIGLITIFFALTNSKDYSVPKFYTYVFMQLAVFVFIVIQFSRGVYLLIVRNYLAKLEQKMKVDLDERLVFEWESIIVPTKIASNYSYSTFSQIVIGFIYILIFGTLCYKSVTYSSGMPEKDLLIPNCYYYWAVLPLEAIFIIYSIICLLWHRKG